MTDKKDIRTVVCPICKKEASWHDNPARPFCSERCRLVDLGTWASEGYWIAGDRKQPPDADQEENNRPEK